MGYCSERKLVSTSEFIYYAQKFTGNQSYTHIGKLSGRYLVHINLAFAANLAGDHAQALSALAQIPTMSATAYSSLTPRILAQIHYQKAEAYLGLGDLDRAESHLYEAMTHEEENLIADCLRVSGEIALERGNFAVAEKSLQQSIAHSGQEANANQYMLGYAWRSLAKVYFQQADEEAAEAAIDHALACFSTVRLEHQISMTQQVRASYGSTLQRYQ